MTRPFVLLGLFLVACGEEVPDRPTYFADVQPILRANCARCHGADPISAAVATFRLDRYVKEDATTFDAWDYAQGSPAPMVRVTVDQEAPAMPPDYELTDRQQQILARWVEQGAPKGDRDNRLPQIALVSPSDVTTADQTIDATIRAWDDDLDGLVVQLWAHDVATGPEADVPLGDPFGAGQRAIALDTGTLASLHAFEIYAVLDDGFHDDPLRNPIRATVIPRVDVDHGARGTAPTVKLLGPNGGETLIGTAPITWTATDPDAGDTLTIDLALVATAADGSETVAAVIADDLANTGSYLWTIPGSVRAVDSDGVPIPYRVRVTATDTLGMPPNTRSDQSDFPVTIATATTTTFTWADVRPIFVTYCRECHGEPASVVANENFRLDKYNAADPEPPTNGDLGVFEMRTQVYQRLVIAGTMPPANKPQPSGADTDKVASWITGGAPFGTGPGDNPPTFTWISPAMMDISPPVTLQWSATDAEGLALGRIQYAHVNGSAGTGCASITIMDGAWVTVPDPRADVTLAGATTWADAFDWTPPATPSGYYCLRATVTDTANQSSPPIRNPYGVK